VSLTEASKHLLIQITPRRVGRAESSLRSFLTLGRGYLRTFHNFHKNRITSKGGALLLHCSAGRLLVKSNFTGWPVSDFPRSHCLPCDLTGQNHQAFVSAHVESIVLGISGFQNTLAARLHAQIHNECTKIKFYEKCQIQRFIQFIDSMSGLPPPNASTRVFFLLKAMMRYFSVPKLKLLQRQENNPCSFLLLTPLRSCNHNR
jgi:hypothetical protein